MDLVDLITEKRFLGQEFLAWLWFKSEERGGNIEVPGLGDILLSFEKHMLLEYGEGESHEKLICRGLQTELEEARTGLRMGKKPEQARMRLARGDYEWQFTLRGSTMEFSNVRPPKTMAASEEGDDPAAVEGMLLERFGLFEELARTVDELFRLFLAVRLSPGWPAETEKIRHWLGSGR